MRAPPPARRGAHRDEHHCSARGRECDVTGNIMKACSRQRFSRFGGCGSQLNPCDREPVTTRGGAGSAAGGPRSMQGASVYGVYMHLSACMQLVFNVCVFAHQMCSKVIHREPWPTSIREYRPPRGSSDERSSWGRFAPSCAVGEAPFRERHERRHATSQRLDGAVLRGRALAT